jgi:ribonuclease Z
MVATFGNVVVESTLVEHSPVTPAVGYRITTAEAVVAVSGDTRVCEGLETLCRDADVAVCEVIRPQGLIGILSDPEKIAAYHADIGQLGAMAARAGVGHLLLTHLIPPPKTQADKQAFVDDIRAAGFDGDLTVADDLDGVTLGS